jgi:hypothetical protein
MIDIGRKPGGHEAKWNGATPEAGPSCPQRSRLGHEYFTKLSTTHISEIRKGLYRRNYSQRVANRDESHLIYCVILENLKLQRVVDAGRLFLFLDCDVDYSGDHLIRTS